MDFWSRLLSPLSTGNTRQDQAKDPAKRLHRFEKEYGNLLLTWRKSSNLSKDSEAAETLEIRLQELTSILSDESRRPLPHPCIQFASLREIYVPIGKIATTSYNEWIIKEAVLFFATLIESEEEAFVENPTFSASLTNLLVRITGANSVRLGLDTESRVVELAFNITTKIRLDPEILPAWFQTRQEGGQKQLDDAAGRENKFAGRTQRADFPLFYILMDYIHHEGKVGDFARTGLLYIIEAASNSSLLEQWIVESDLSTLMATGLGALYSQLSRKLVIDHPSYNLPPILAFSDYQHPTSNLEIVSSCSPEFQLHLETFLSHLLFWQDVLNHCKSDEVKSTLLEHFQVIFLQQLLYPSLLESSDIDGGSSVAVLTYLRRILESLDHPDMINLILHYLLALPEAINPSETDPHTPIGDARRRKSKDLASMVASAKGDNAATPLLFNLVDLVLACLRSRNQQTIQTTLQLVSAILKRHHRYAVITLLRTEVLPLSNTHRTIGAHEQEVQYLMDLAGSVGGQDNFDDVYDDMCKDTMARLESHPCSLHLIAPMVGKHNHRQTTVHESLRGSPREVREHTLTPDDPLLNALLDILETFFMNSVETNLSVTETLVDLGICGYMSIEGWLSRNPESYVYDSDTSEQEVNGDAQSSEDEEDDEEAAGDKDEGEKEEGEDEQKEAEKKKEEPTITLPPPAPTAEDNARRAREARDAREAEREEAMKNCRRKPRWDQSSIPRALGLLRRLCDQVERYKETIPRFEELLQQRREAFYTADMIVTSPMIPRERTPAPQGTSDHPMTEDGHRSQSPSRPSAFEGFAQRLLAELGTPSRSGSPRGRKDKLRGSAAASGNATPSHRIDNYGLATPKAIPIPPFKDFFSTDHHGKASSLPRTLSPSRIGDDIGLSFDSQEGMFASRMADFAAVDQTILARRVGLPAHRLSPIPLQFDRPRMPEGSEAATSTADDDEDEEEEEDDDNPAIKPSEDEEGDDTDLDVDEPEESKADEQDDGERKETASVSHIITNVIIFQSFVFELASLVQVRAGLFNEVRFA